MKRRFQNLVCASLLGILVSPVLADDPPFIVLGPNVKVVFTQEVIDGFSVTLATATISETTPDAITVKRQTQKPSR
ncbi:MAG: hypothetical protein P1U90_17550 [Akkermansiaceae bacterium]|nr:hypothetical protein [Akkermansiaceae bacterium]